MARIHSQKIYCAFMALILALLMLSLLCPGAYAAEDFLSWRSYNPVMGNGDYSYATWNAVGNYSINGKDSYGLTPFIQAGDSYVEGTVDQIPDHLGRYIRSNMADVETAYRFAAAAELGWVTKETAAEGIYWTVPSVQSYGDYDTLKGVADTLSNAYNAVNNEINRHGGFSEPTQPQHPSFCGETSDSNPWIFLTRTSGGYYTGSVNDSNGVLDYYNFSALSDGITYTRTGNNLTVSVPESVITSLFTKRPDGSGIYTTGLVKGSNSNSGYVYEGKLWVADCEDHDYQPMVTVTANPWTAYFNASLTLYVEQLPTPTPTPAPTVAPTETPVQSAVQTNEAASEPAATAEPTATPEPTVTPEPTAEPTATPEPTSEPVQNTEIINSTGSSLASTGSISSEQQALLQLAAEKQAAREAEEQSLSHVTDSGDVVLLKRDAVSGAPVAGAEISVYTSKGAPAARVSTDENGQVIISGLKAGDYTYREMSAPSGYQKNSDTYSFKVTSGGSINGTVITDSAPDGTAVIRVTSSDGEKLQGVLLTVSDGSGQTTGIVTDSDGKAYFTPESEGTYTFSETYVPDGYEINTGSYSFTISKSGPATGVTAILNEASEAMQTGSAGSVLPWIIMLVILLGIGAVCVIKRRQLVSFLENITGRFTRR